MFDKLFRDRKSIPSIPCPHPMPPVKEPDSATNPNVYYRIGVVDGGRVSMKIGFSEITMSQAGLKHLIQHLSAFLGDQE